MPAEIRVIHWYDTTHHRNACGAPGQSNSTKHRRAVTCTACRACIAAGPARLPADAEPAASWLQ